METVINKPTIIINNGHGGIINGVYQTAGKRSPKWNDDSQLYEGVFNRIIVTGIAERLAKLSIDHVVLVPGQKDISLRTRVYEANLLYKLNQNCLYLSIHSNAGGGSGSEIFTSPGQTKSDKIASVFGQHYMWHFPEMKLRTDPSDGDIDKEARFYELIHTKMPAVLTENFFMDNEYECRNILMTDHGREKIINWHVAAIQECIDKNLI